MCFDRATSQVLPITKRPNNELRSVQTARKFGGSRVRPVGNADGNCRPVESEGEQLTRRGRRHRDPRRSSQACRWTSRHSRVTIGNTRPADWKSKRAQHVRRWTTRFAVSAMNVRSCWVFFLTISVVWMCVL